MDHWQLYVFFCLNIPDVDSDEEGGPPMKKIRSSRGVVTGGATGGAGQTRIAFVFLQPGDRFLSKRVLKKPKSIQVEGNWNSRKFQNIPEFYGMKRN